VRRKSRVAAGADLLLIGLDEGGRPDVVILKSLWQ